MILRWPAHGINNSSTASKPQGEGSACTPKTMIETRPPQRRVLARTLTRPQHRVLARTRNNTKVIHSKGKAKGDGRGNVQQFLMTSTYSHTPEITLLELKAHVQTIRGYTRIAACSKCQTVKQPSRLALGEWEKCRTPRHWAIVHTKEKRTTKP